MSKYFNCFLPPFLCLEYCFRVWSSAADSHLRLSDTVVSSVKILLTNLSIDLWHRHELSSLYLFHKIYHNNKYHLHSSLPDLAIFTHNTRRAAAANSILFSSVRFITTQFSRSFILATTKMWNACLVQLWSLLISRTLRGEQSYSCYLMLSVDSHFYLIALSPSPFPLFCS